MWGTVGVPFLSSNRQGLVNVRMHISAGQNIPLDMHKAVIREIAEGINHHQRWTRKIKQLLPQTLNLHPGKHVNQVLQRGARTTSH